MEGLLIGMMVLSFISIQSQGKFCSISNVSTELNARYPRFIAYSILTGVVHILCISTLECILHQQDVS